MTLITSECGATRSLGIKWPQSPRVVCPQALVFFPGLANGEKDKLAVHASCPVRTAAGTGQPAPNKHVRPRTPRTPHRLVFRHYVSCFRHITSPGVHAVHSLRAYTLCGRRWCGTSQHGLSSKTMTLITSECGRRWCSSGSTGRRLTGWRAGQARLEAKLGSAARRKGGGGRLAAAAARSRSRRSRRSRRATYDPRRWPRVDHGPFWSKMVQNFGQNGPWATVAATVGGGGRSAAASSFE